jgi:hypothetical protein
MVPIIPSGSGRREPRLYDFSMVRRPDTPAADESIFNKSVVQTESADRNRATPGLSELIHMSEKSLDLGDSSREQPINNLADGLRTAKRRDATSP